MEAKEKLATFLGAAAVTQFYPPVASHQTSEYKPRSSITGKQASKTKNRRRMVKFSRRKNRP